MCNMKRLLKTACCLLVCCLCVSCASAGKELRPTNKLVLYYPELLSTGVRTAISMFRNQFPDVEIDKRVFSGGFSEYSQLLKTEVMAGKGPDLIFFWGDEFQDTEKAMDAGVFYDIDTFMDEDTSFDRSQFQPNILDGGYYKGKRFYIPLCYQAMSVVTTEEAMEAFGIQLSDNATFEDWMNECIQWLRNNPEDTRVLTHSPTESPYFYGTFFSVRYVDLETGEILIDRDAFRLFMEFLKLKFPKLEYGNSALSSAGGNRLVENIQADQLLFYFYLMHQNLGMRQALSETRTARSLIPPSMGSEQPLATGRIMAAINNGSPNKVNAYEFLKIMLSTKVQSQPNFPIPVNNEALEYQLKSEGVQYDLSEDEIDRMYAEIQSLGYIHPLSYTQYDLFEDAMRPWFLDEKSYEDCLDDFRNRLEIFVDE